LVKVLLLIVSSEVFREKGGGVHRLQTVGGPPLPVTNEIIMKTTAITNSTWAIQYASPATPQAPNASAIRAIIKKMIAYLSMA
jgi:hypothetical protein